MNTITITYDDRQVLSMLERLRRQLTGPMTPVMAEIAALIKSSVQENFIQGGRPDKWVESRRVKKDGGQTLVEGGRLRDSIIDHATATTAEVGTNLKYAAIHQFGGPIKRPAHERVLLFDHSRKFATAKKAKYGMKATIGGHTTNMPARPFLMIQEQDQAAIVGIIQRYLQG